MALFTEDIELRNDQGWVALVLTGTVIHITSIKNGKIYYRFGIGSSSKGTELNKEEGISAEETIYVRYGNSSSDSVTITVTKD